ncbi:MAG: Cof-type HAD-IIB family hydrolase [Clostridium sp.]
MKYKLICTDMDGTLLGKGFSISDENVRAIKEVKESGVQVALVTGRPYNAMRYFQSIVGEDVHIISTNGTYFKLGDYEYKKNLDKKSIEKIFILGEKYNLSRHFKGCNRVIASDDIKEDHPYRLVNSKNAEEDRISITENATLQIALEKCEDEILKCIVFSDDYESLAKAKEEIKQDKDLVVVSSSARNFEVMPKGTSKGIAVRNFCEILGIDSKEVVCIGDNENDLSMIEFAGLGIAMGNGSEEVKSKAHYVTDTNVNSGVAKALDKFILNK